MCKVLLGSSNTNMKIRALVLKDLVDIRGNPPIIV